MAQTHTAAISHYGVAFYMLFGLFTYASGATDSADLPSSAAMPPRINPAPSGIENLHDFDIPAQSLEAALYQYADVSNQPALFASDMMVGRTSSAVRGRYSSEAALHLLLEGTGLVAEKLGSYQGQTFLLKEAGSKDAVARAALSSLDGYPGLMQARIWQALCADPRTAPGHYRSLFSFQVDAGGHLHDARLLDSSGDAHRDAALLATLQRVQIEPPPAGMPQPLIMTLLPSTPDTGSPCSQNKGAP